MAKSKLQRLGPEEVARRVKIKQKIRKRRDLKKKINSISVYGNVGLLIYIAHLHGKLVPTLTNIYETIVSKVAPIVESLINQLPL